MVHDGALAVVAAGLPVAHVHLSAAMATSQQAREYEFAPSCRPARDGAALSGRVVRDPTVVALGLLPGEVSFVLVFQQPVPLRAGRAKSAPHALSPVLDDDLARRAPEGIGASIDWIGEDVVHGVVERQLPDDAASFLVMRLGGQLDAFVSEPHMHLAYALELREFREDKAQGILHTSIGILLDAVAPGLHVACRNAEEQRAATRLLHQRLLRALAEQRQLKLAHRALHAEQQPIIGMARIIDSVLVDENGSDQSTELDQRMPIATIAGEARRLDRDHGPDAALADRSQQALEAWTADATARATEIIIDHLDADPTELARAIHKPILPALALLIVQELVGRRLADVDDGTAREMFSGDLAHRRPPRLQAPRRSR